MPRPASPSRARAPGRTPTSALAALAVLATLVPIALWGASSSAAAAPRLTAPSPSPDPLIPLDSVRGAELFTALVQDQLAVSGRSVALEVLARLETQENLGACAPASAVSVLNAMRVPFAPRDPVYAMFGGTGYAFWTQHAYVFQPCVVKTLGARVYGETLEDFAKTLACFGLKTKAVTATAAVADADVVGDVERRTLRGDAVIVNFDRAALGQPGGGHFSPVGGSVQGYFLVLDVARFKYRPYFVTHRALVDGMRSPDSQSLGKPRGYVVLEWVSSASASSFSGLGSDTATDSEAVLARALKAAAASPSSDSSSRARLRGSVGEGVESVGAIVDVVAA